MSTNLLAGDLNGLTNDELYSAVEEFAVAQPVEGWRHDYTELWDDESGLKNVAAFANTFGGTLIVGVKKGKRDSACQIVGVSSSVEYKTKIANSISANISPTPPYEVFECHFPTDDSTRLCVVRIRADGALHLVTKKQMHPAFVRNEDTSDPANASQLRALIERERNASKNLAELPERAYAVRDALNIRRKYQEPDSERWFLSPSEGSDTSLKIELIPSERVRVALDRPEEEDFRRLIRSHCPRIGGTYGKVAGEAADRGADYFQYVWYHKNADYEVRWRVTETGEIGQGNRMESDYSGGPGKWSIVDLVSQVIIIARLGLTWWQTHGYFGEGRLFAQLNVGQLPIAQDIVDGSYVGLADMMHPLVGATRIPYGAVQPSASPRTSANASVPWNYFSASESLSTVVAPLLNQLLRGLGHSADLKTLEESVRLLDEYSALKTATGKS